MEKYLNQLYKRFIILDKNYLVLDAKKYSTSLEKLKISDREVSQFYKNYYQPSFIDFLSDIKDIIYSENVLEFIQKTSSEDWNLWPYLDFLVKEKIIKVEKSGRPILLKKELKKVLLPPLKEGEIKNILEKKLGVRIKKNDYVINLFKKICHFRVKKEWDQMPISQGSALFLVSKISEVLPLRGPFLFVGDDDFISVILALSNPDFQLKVIDADKEVLSSIAFLADKFNLKIETERLDIRKRRKSKEKFIGFLTNPVYTQAGVEEFMGFGIRQLSDKGAKVFLEVGDESIGRRFLFLQDFFSKNNLVIDEIIKRKISYPYIMLYKEDKEILRRFASLIKEGVIKRYPKLAASLYIFRYLPKRPKKLKRKGEFYAYL